MKKAACLLLSALILLGAGWSMSAAGAAETSTPDDGASETLLTLAADDGASDAVVALLADDDAGNSDAGNSDAGNSDTGNSDDTGESDGTEPLPLPTPTRLGWGRDYRFLLDYYRREDPDRIRADETGAEYVECPGMMYWSAGGENQRLYRIDLYRRGGEEDAEGAVLVETVKEWKVSGENAMESNFRFFWSARVSGDYYFTVRAIGDGSIYLDSETAQSDIWTYEAPEAQLTRPTRPRWKNVSETSTAFIYPPANEDPDIDNHRVGYAAQWWYVAALTNETTQETEEDTGNTSMIVRPDDGQTQEDRTKPKEAGTVLTFYPKHYEFKPSDKMIGEYGSGYYSVQIRALSGDIYQARPSDWSEPTMVRYIAADDDNLWTIVNRVDRNTDDFNRQLAINNIRKFGTYKLTELMAADTDNTGAVAAIEQLENMTGNYAQIVVSGGLDELFPEQNIGVIGAGLNVDLGQTVVFHLGAAHSDEVPSTLYSHAVRFSMQLLDRNNASLTPNSTELKVPAKITLPVPDSINPSFFVILHHRMDGTVETLPHVALRKVEQTVTVTEQTEDGERETEKTVEQWYASFIVTSFSDFTMAEAAAFMEGKAVSGGVSLSYRFKTDGVKTALCAVRDAAGRVQAVAKLDLSQTRKTVMIPCKGAADSVKLFLLDANSAPVVAALTVPVAKS